MESTTLRTNPVDSGDYEVGPSITTNAHFCWGLLMVGGVMQVWGQGEYGKSLYLPLSLAVNLKLLFKNVFKKI